MATKAQIAANRRNAQHATGPRTDVGKAIIRQNALRHGLCSGIPSMEDETDEEVRQLLDILREEHEPIGAHEEILVYKMAEHFFFQKRASYLLTEQLTSADHGSDNAGMTSLFLRYHTTADRGYNRALADLRKLQKERQLEEIGFVSQNAEVAPQEAENAAVENAAVENPAVENSPVEHPAPETPAESAAPETAPPSQPQPAQPPVQPDVLIADPAVKASQPAQTSKQSAKPAPLQPFLNPGQVCYREPTFEELEIAVNAFLCGR